MRFLEGSSPPHGLVYVNLPLATSTSVTYTKPATLLDSSSACVFPWLTANTEFSSAMLGPTDVGKSSLAKILLNYAVRKGWAPTFADLDLGQGGITCPATVGATPVDRPVDVAEGDDAAGRGHLEGRVGRLLVAARGVRGALRGSLGGGAERGRDGAARERGELPRRVAGHLRGETRPAQRESAERAGGAAHHPALLPNTVMCLRPFEALRSNLREIPR